MRNDLRIGLVELFATEDGTLFGPRLKDLYDAHHVVIRPARMAPHVLQGELVSLEKIPQEFHLYCQRYAKFRSEPILKAFFNNDSLRNLPPAGMG